MSYERLTEWVEKDMRVAGVIGGGCPIDKLEANAINRLAELEDKIENGTLVRLPCKMGQKLSFIVLNKRTGQFEIFSTEHWVFQSIFNDDKGGFVFIIRINDIDFDYDNFIQTDDYYLDLSEAEKKLAEIKGE